jgi:hypothetical protein
LYRRSAIALGFISAVLTLVSCATEDNGGEEPGVGDGAGPASRAEETAPAVFDDRLADTFTYASGTVRFDPPPPRYSPVKSADEAYGIFSASDAADYSPVFAERQPQEFLADYTTIGSGPGVDRDPGQVGWDHVHSWVIRFTDIPGEAAGPGVPPSSTESPDDTVYYEDVVVVINSDTGQILTLYHSLPDG